MTFADLELVKKHCEELARVRYSLDDSVDGEGVLNEVVIASGKVVARLQLIRAIRLQSFLFKQQQFGPPAQHSARCRAFFVFSSVLRGMLHVRELTCHDVAFGVSTCHLHLSVFPNYA